MKVLSVNVGKLALLPGKSKRTAIDKRPVDGDVQVTQDGLEGDRIGDHTHHGGPDQAVYVYGQPDYDWWSKALGRALTPGTFGENLTIEGFESAAASVGDRFQIGDVVLEITASRLPCGTLARRMEDMEFINRFRAAERPGAYCRVIATGHVSAGDEVKYVRTTAADAINLVEMFRDYYDPTMTEPHIRRYLAAPIALRARELKTEQLQKVLASR